MSAASFGPASPFGLPVEELKKLPGFQPDIAKSREEAKRLLKEAGVTNLKFKLLNRTIAQPFTPAGIYAMDQWRRIGVESEHVQVETKLWYDGMESGNFDVCVQNIADFTDDPNAQFNTLLSKKVSAIAYSRHTDTKIDDMYTLQSGTVDPAARTQDRPRAREVRADAGLQRPAAVVSADHRQQREDQGLGADAQPLHRPAADRRLARRVGRSTIPLPARAGRGERAWTHPPDRTP